MAQPNHRRHTLLKHTHLAADITDLVTILAALDLTDLADVTITSPATGEVLTYNGSVWVNSASTGGGGGFPPQLAWAGIR